MKKILFGVMAALTLSVVGDTLPVLGGYAGSLEFPDASLYFQPCVFAHGWNRRSAEPKFTEPKSVHLFRVSLIRRGRRIHRRTGDLHADRRRGRSRLEPADKQRAEVCRTGGRAHHILANALRRRQRDGGR